MFWKSKNMNLLSRRPTLKKKIPSPYGKRTEDTLMSFYAGDYNNRGERGDAKKL
jgi:hypothetical protein